MKRLTSLLFLNLLIFNLSISYAEEKPVMGFGYLMNISDDKNFNYLETIFPSSFASSLRNIFDVEVYKPHEVNIVLKRFNMSLKKSYSTFEIPELVEKIESDIFIYGYFTPLPRERIKIVLNLYEKGTSNMFTFTNIGRMETEIFKLVDRITGILINYMDKEKIFRSSRIMPGARIGIITNIEGENLNKLYFSFLKKGFRVMSIQSNSLGNIISGSDLLPMKYISTRNNSYDIITDMRKIKLSYGTWAGKKHIEKMDRIKSIFKTYDMDYLATKETLLNKLIKSHSGKIDNLLIIGIKKTHESAWVRCIDLNKKELIWMQSMITGRGIKSLSKNIIARMTSKQKSPFKKKKSKKIK